MPPFEAARAATPRRAVAVVVIGGQTLALVTRLRTRYGIRRTASARDVARPALAGGSNGAGGDTQRSGHD